MTGSLLQLGLPFAALLRRRRSGPARAERWLGRAQRPRGTRATSDRWTGGRSRSWPPTSAGCAASWPSCPPGAPMARRRALQAAYDDVLIEAARACSRCRTR